MKRSFQFTKYINKSIKVGDKVHFFDGSGISCDKQDVSKNPHLSIIFKYPLLTGRNIPLKEIEGEVIKVNVKDRVSIIDGQFAYFQDCVVKLGNGLFRTPSGFLRKVE